MTRFINTPESTIRNNQKTIKGEIFISKNFQLENTNNDGINVLDSLRYDVKNSVINLAAGTKVNLVIQEMVTGTSYRITYKKDGITYAKTMVK